MKKTIEDIQQVLNAAGYYAGLIDGDFGAKSQAALDAAIAVANAPEPQLHIIEVVRDRQTQRSTTSRYTAGKLSGFMLECPGPSTTQAGQRKRIPAGTYQIVWHDGTKYRGVVRLYNDQVPQSRAILIHVGNYPSNTDGCLLAGMTRGVDVVGASRGAVTELMQWIRACGVDNVRVVIKDQF